MKRLLVSVIVVTFTVLFALSIRIDAVNAQDSMVDQGKALMEKGKTMQEGKPAEKAPTVGKDESSRKGTSTEQQEQLMEKGKELMEKKDLMDKGKGLMEK